MIINRRNMLFGTLIAPLVSLLPKDFLKKEKKYGKLVDYNSENDWKLIQHQICLRYRQCGHKSLLPRFWLDN